MVAQIAQAAAAYANVAGSAASPGMEARDRLPSLDFGDMVRDSIAGAVNAGQAAEQMSGQALLGRADVSEVVMAVNNAEVSLQTIVSIRDKMIEAYQQIIRMPV